jgi:hypothetical protein
MLSIALIVSRSVYDAVTAHCLDDGDDVVSAVSGRRERRSEGDYATADREI